MPEKRLSPGVRSTLPTKARIAGILIASLCRLVNLTCRYRLHDPSGISESPPDKPMIWLFWHNRTFAMSTVRRKYLPTRAGAIMTSMSKDGNYIAAFCEAIGMSAVRGSSSRRGAAALLELIEWIEQDFDVAIVPDGPRGPRYRLGPGAIKLAQVTGAYLLPIRIVYGSAWVFKSWDRFQLPRPFTTVDVYFEPLEAVPSGLDQEEFEKKRQRIERIMNPENETD